MIKYIIVFISIYSLLFSSELNFGKFDGSGVIFDLNSSKKEIFGSRTDERLSPCSTFKILNSMIALDLKVVKDENETLLWDKKVRAYEVWNKNHSMRSAIGVSTVWFYQEMAKRVGTVRMQDMLKRVNYGNADMSHSLTDFWLGDGSLKISVNEQIKFLTKLMRNELPFSNNSTNTLKDIITLEKQPNYTLAGKTGSCGGVGWFVGFVEHNNSTRVFAFNIKGDGASGAEIKKIVIEYLR
ncbi:MAG: penicillin-binding transpeptidase domain-containing protein [Sulfurimonas sp.]|uniref:penicillin-binding transpeptidase domain-containing protein n=1 Tax=Sulfurimonas sp. TaxID=2022749 RepID=UPI00261D2285|nr:penicillin-binding transpeptidase domain-containing protein [Sulfurimonas sp.]MCW8895033.1 penicillin-binding transpeptidase domain-containing protein [Sulfurimonas sp.]MCW8953635.1 penicillin-binding transpeptidase domain-containing protein [Sulfurimonas sp.]MCW9067348.1 penicillin-binding transpeptidase domain-containing protein [Sulfurimonas sp.]